MDSDEAAPCFNYSNCKKERKVSNEDVSINLDYPCSRKRLFFMYVFSAPGNVALRKRIRRTWGKAAEIEKYNGEMAFIIGLSDNDRINRKIRKESNKYRDIIQFKYIDSYQNLTKKGFLTLKWLNHYCKNVKFVIKADDDTLINVRNLHRFMTSPARLEQPRTFYCYVFRNNSVGRTGKYAVSKHQLPQNTFPVYCNGPCWLVTNDVISSLYKTALVVPFLPVEDAYTSGVLPSRLRGVKHVHYPGFNTFPVDLPLDFYKTSESLNSISSKPGRGVYEKAWVITKRLGTKPMVDAFRSQ